jgi:hypothetical protein
VTKCNECGSEVSTVICSLWETCEVKECSHITFHKKNGECDKKCMKSGRDETLPCFFVVKGAKEFEPWIGVDLDGTLAYYDHWRGPEHVGEPIPAMLERVIDWVLHGKVVGTKLVKKVKIFTARACVPEQIPPIKAWLTQYGLGYLEVTCVKDFGMVELWDDRCIQVIPNTGQTIAEFATELHKDIQNERNRR